MSWWQKKQLLRTEEISCKIRAIVGIGNNMVQGIGLLYQKRNGSAGFMNIWRDRDDDLGLIRFVDEGESRIVFRRSIWSDGTNDDVLDRIYIR